MKHRTLAIILIVLLGGMALYYNKSASENTNAKGDNATSVEKSK
jgi:uncharacterized protein YpmB